VALVAGCAEEPAGPDPAPAPPAANRADDGSIASPPASSSSGGVAPIAPIAPAPDGVADPLLAILEALPPIGMVQASDPPPLPAALVPFFRLIEDGRPDVARVRIRKHLALNPDDGFAHFLFGLTYHRERQYTEAMPWFTDAIRLAPTYDPSFYFAGWGRFYLGDLDAAERLWTRHLAFRPDAADTHFGLGLVDLERGRAAEAAERFRTAIALEADTPGRARSVAKAWARLGDALNDLGEPEEARTALERAVALWPDHHEAWARLARLARRLGDEPAAERAETEAEAAFARTRGADSERP
jgi:tetratricopeptide (TPR) repeat protein